MKQILLNAKGCSGRGVRLELLSSMTRTKIQEQAAKEIGPEGTIAEWRAREECDGIVAMVVQVTERASFAKKEDLLAADVVWKKLTGEALEQKLGELFNTKDLDALAKTYRYYHDVTQKELDDILGEALDVTED